MLWCDDCDDVVSVAKLLIVVYPNGKSKKAISDLMEMLQQYVL